MISVNKLFGQRVKQDYLFQWKAFRLAVDWIVALYIVIPILGIMVVADIATWRQPPEWFAACSSVTIYITLFLFAILINVRTFIQPADQVIMFQSKVWVSHLRNYAYVFAVLKHALYSGLLIVYILPLLIYKDMTPLQIVATWLNLTLFSYGYGLFKRFHYFISSWWRKWAVRIGVTGLLAVSFQFMQNQLLNSPFLFLGCWALLLIAVYLTYRLVVYKSGIYFLREVEYEQMEQYRYVSLLLQQAGIPKPVKRRKKPPIYARSFVLFKKREVRYILAESFIKVTLRDTEWLKMYLGFLALTLVGIWTSPVWVGLLLYFAHVFLTAMWLKTLWTGYMYSTFLRMFKWDMGDILRGCRQMLFTFTLPGSIVVSIIWGVHSSELYPLLAALLICIPVSRLVSSIFTRWYKP